MVGTMATTMVGHTAFAAACSQTTAAIVTSPATSVTCTTGLTANNPSGVLALLSDPNVTINPTGHVSTDPHVPNFGFNSSVSDDRGINNPPLPGPLPGNTGGWRLQASYAEVSAPAGGTGIVFPGLTSVGTFTPTPTITGGLCVAPTYIGGTVALTGGTDHTFVTMDPGTTAINCAETFPTYGSIDFTAVSAPAGLYTGTITLTLLNTAS